MPLSRLATVEVQLIMHCCDRTSLLAFARCSRHTFTAAFSDFAWKYTQLHFTFTHPFSPLPKVKTGVMASVRRLLAARRPRPSLADLLRGSSLLRPLPVSLELASASSPSLQLTAPQLDALLSVDHLAALAVGSPSAVPYEHWARLSASPALHSLTSLRAPAFVLAAPRFLTRLAASAHSLRSLHFDGGMTRGTGIVGPAVMVGFWRFTQLRELHFTDFAAEEASVREALADVQPHPLEVLHLRGVPAPAAHAMLTSPALSRLRHLTLTLSSGRRHPHQVIPDDAPPQMDWAACFANLPHLRSLTLLNSHGVPGVLEGLLQGTGEEAPPQLEQLRLASFDWQEEGYVNPPVAQLERLLTRCPRLTIQLEFVKALHHFNPEHVWEYEDLAAARPLRILLLLHPYFMLTRCETCRVVADMRAHDVCLWCGQSLTRLVMR